eukprot:gene6344-2970_t
MGSSGTPELRDKRTISCSDLNPRDLNETQHAGSILDRLATELRTIPLQITMRGITGPVSSAPARSSARRPPTTPRHAGPLPHPHPTASHSQAISRNFSLAATESRSEVNPDVAALVREVQELRETVKEMRDEMRKGPALPVGDGRMEGPAARSMDTMDNFDR